MNALDKWIAGHRKAISALGLAYLGAIGKSMSDGNLTTTELIASLGFGLTGFVTGYITPANDVKDA